MKRLIKRLFGRRNFTAREQLILEVDAAARLRESGRLLKWAEANIHAGRLAKERGDEQGRALYGAKAQALIAASRFVANPGLRISTERKPRRSS